MKLDQRLSSLRSKIDRIQSLISPHVLQHAEHVLVKENSELETKVRQLKDKLRHIELQFGIIQHDIPVIRKDESTSLVETTAINPSKNTLPLNLNDSVVSPEPSKLKSVKGGTRACNTGVPKTSEDLAVDIGRLDLRVGRIVEVTYHPQAESLYVEKVDFGEGRLRTVVSGLVKYVPADYLHNFIGVFTCNLKAAKIRGIESQAMLMCASAPESGSVEPLLLSSPEVQLGESIIVPGFSHNPDELLNPKKKIFEQVKPDLRCDDEGFATYKGVRWTLKNHPNVTIRAPKLRDVQIS